MNWQARQYFHLYGFGGAIVLGGVVGAMSKGLEGAVAGALSTAAVASLIIGGASLYAQACDSDQ